MNGHFEPKGTKKKSLLKYESSLKCFFTYNLLTIRDIDMKLILETRMAYLNILEYVKLMIYFFKCFYKTLEKLLCSEAYIKKH